MGDILQTSYKDAERFYRECQATTTGVTLNNKGEWWIFVEKGQVLGMLSTQQLGQWKRIKSLLVRPGHRGQGIASKLVAHVSDGKCTAFAFDDSKPIFEKFGFKVEKQHKNGNWFLRKE